MNRWLKFNAVGAAGIAVQLAALALLKSLLHVEYLLATGAAVEVAVLHNFFWHQRWTWQDREKAGLFRRLLRFNLTNGLLSIVSNVVLMRLFVGQWRLPYLLANGIAIAVTSVLNFVLSDRFVFR